MKNIFILLVSSLFLIVLYSFRVSDENKVEKKGIHFFEGTLKEALQKASEENKPIFIDVYATWCGPCKQLKKSTFKDEEVGTYFNKNFVNIAIDGETKEGIEMINKYAIQGYPTLMIIDKDGKLLAKQMGFIKPHILVNFGRRIVY
jgi:thioredoxin 1